MLWTILIATGLMLVTDIEPKVQLNKFYFYMSNVLISIVFLNDVIPDIINGVKRLKKKLMKCIDSGKRLMHKTK